MGNQDLGNETELSRVAEKTLKHATFSYINTNIIWKKTWIHNYVAGLTVHANLYFFLCFGDRAVPPSIDRFWRPLLYINMKNFSLSMVLTARDQKAQILFLKADNSLPTITSHRAETPGAESGPNPVQLFRRCLRWSCMDFIAGVFRMVEKSQMNDWTWLLNPNSAHCDSWLLCAIQILLLTYLLTFQSANYCSELCKVW